MGFDNEKPNTDQAILKCIEDTGICMSMIGLLVALPNTQLTRRLISEKRLINMKGKIIDIPELALEQYESDLSTHVIDQTQAGLNFITTRDRLEILNEYANAVRQAYDPRRYFDRALRTARMMKYRAPRTQGWWEMKRSIRSLVVMAWKMTLNSTTRRLYWRNVILGMGLGLHRFEVVLTLSSVYLHFHKQSNYLLGVLDEQIRRQARLPRQIGSGDMAGFVLEVNSKR
jgi:hypothetical protein